MYTNILSKFQDIVPGMQIDIERLEILKDFIYTYKYKNSIIRMKDYVYSICWYFDKLMMNAADTTPLIQFFMEYIDNCNETERYAIEVKRDIFEKNPDIFSINLKDEPDIFIIEPLERQTNAPPPDEPVVGLVIDFMDNWRDCTYHKNQILYATSAYIGKLSLDISYIKSQLIKLEFARCGRISGTALDVIIDEMYDKLIILNDEMRRYMIRESSLCYDKQVEEMRCYSQEQALRQIFYEHYRNFCTLYPYNLPRSVIKDCADKPDLWKIVCKERGLLGNLLKCPCAKNE